MLKFQQKKAEKDEKTEYFYLGLKFDTANFPYTTAYQGRGKKQHTKEVEGMGHTALLRQQPVVDWVAASLEDETVEASGSQ